MDDDMTYRDDESRRKHSFPADDLFRQVTDRSRSMISIINRDYKYEKVNATFCNEHQVTSDAMVGRSLADVWGEETFNTSIRKNIDRCFSGETVNYKASFNTPLNGKKYFEVIFSPLAGEKNEITRLVAETFGIDELMQTHEALLEREEELRKYDTNLPIGILRCRPDGSIIHVNKAFSAIMGCSAVDVEKGLNFRDFYPAGILFDIQMSQLAGSPSLSFGRVSLLNRKGQEIPCRLSGFMETNETGAPSFADFAIEDSTRELILENKLIQAQKLETIGALAGGIAHDFNNILATISGYSELLREELPKDSKEAEMAHKIQGSVVRAQSLIGQILTFSRHIEQEKIPVSVAEILEETIGFFAPSVPPGIVVHNEVKSNDIRVLADPTQLFRVFLNLMTNAVQAMEDYGGTLTVTLDRADGKTVQYELVRDIVADEYVILNFSDTGRGMDQAVLGRIFEPFYTTREAGKGTGLGLSVIHGIINELEGGILAASIPGQGSEFRVFLPVYQSPAYSNGSEIDRRKILFITGNLHESRILSMAMSGHELIYISDRQGLVNILGEGGLRPDAVIYMSETTQVEPDDLLMLYRQLKLNIPFILISENVRGHFEEKLLNSGVVKQQLLKPVSLKELRYAIQMAVER
jgi:signal transduction histidine kinase